MVRNHVLPFAPLVCQWSAWEMPGQLLSWSGAISVATALFRGSGHGKWSALRVDNHARIRDLGFRSMVSDESGQRGVHLQASSAMSPFADSMYVWPATPS